MKRIFVILLLFSIVVIAQPRTGLATKAQLDTVIVKQELVLDSLNIANNLQRDGNAFSETTNSKLADLLDSTNVGNNLQRNTITELEDINTELDGIKTSIDIRTTLVNTTGGYGAKSIGTSATQLSVSSVITKKITVVNNTNGAIIYYGYDGSLTTSNGSGVLFYLDSKDFTLDNLNKIYLISNIITDVRYDYEN